MTKVHLLAGPNNSGKSNVLAVAQRGLPSLRGAGPLKLADVDVPLALARASSRGFRLAVARRVTDDDLAAAASGTGEVKPSSLLGVLVGSTFGPDERGNLWFEFEPETRGSSPRWVPTTEQIKDVDTAGTRAQPGGSRLQALSSNLTGQSGGGPGEDAKRVLEHVIRALNLQTEIPPVATIGAFRRIWSGGGDTTDDEYNGSGLIERLAELQHPGFDRPEDRERFEAINRFLQTLFDDGRAAIEIPHNRETILVHHADQRLPLENYGTGFHQVVILAAAATVLSGYLICIEEPEVHLHPTLQRKLLRYLHEETDNQYLIATHSAHLLDAERASISAVRLDEGNTRIAPAIEPSEVAAISAELGFRASDLVQANAVIWVEGPSDRIYVRHWISQLDPELVEGIHFSIMFYGGRLLKHLSPKDPAVEEFIALPRINRNFSVVIDSDRPRKGASIGATKNRVRREIERNGGAGFVWVTKGYTIENYVPSELLAAAVKRVHKTASCAWSGDLYANPLGEGQITGRSSAVDKTAVARAVIQQWAKDPPWPHDLQKQVSRLVSMVRRTNDLPLPR